MRRHRNTSKPLSHPSRFGRRAGLALSLAVGLTAAMALPALSAVAPSPALQPATRSTGHRYGVVPTRNANSGLSPASGTASTSSGSYLPLQYGGGYNGEGVTTGAPKVYLVFWGSQWGTPSINSQGLTTFSLDADGLAPYLQSFLAGLGTNGETWSGVVTQYCQGVAVGATNCPSSAPHVPAPQGGCWRESGPTPPRRPRRRPPGASWPRRRPTRRCTSATPPRRPIATPSTSSCHPAAPIRTASARQPGASAPGMMQSPPQQDRSRSSTCPMCPTCFRVAG